MTLTLSSPAFAHGEPMPRVCTCEGEDRSPPLSWSGAPPGTKSFAFIVDDPDAPDPKAPKRTYVHWVLYDVPANVTALPDGASSDRLPRGSVELKNDSGGTRYKGPCPPIGCHRYFHKLYALDATLGKVADPTKSGLLKAMDGHVLAQAELVGTYELEGRGGRG